MFHVPGLPDEISWVVADKKNLHLDTGNECVQHTHAGHFTSKLKGQVYCCFQESWKSWDANQMIQYFIHQYGGGGDKLRLGSSAGSKTRTSLENFFKSFKKKYAAATIAKIDPGMNIGSFGAIASMAKSFEFVPTNDHQMYLIGMWMDADNGIVCLVFSTINLLLNAYRMYFVPGMAPFFSVDMAYRLMLEGHGHMNIGTVDAGQVFHIIAAGIVSHENTATHQFVFRAIKTEVERIVEERSLAGKRID